jgi:hypothetical protein
MSETVSACPECDSPAIRRQTHRWVSPDTPQSEWRDRYGLAHEDFDTHRCRDCDAEFDSPNEREPQNNRGYSGLVADLLEADADEVSANE